MKDITKKTSDVERQMKKLEKDLNLQFVDIKNRVFVKNKKGKFFCKICNMYMPSTSANKRMYNFKLHLVKHTKKELAFILTPEDIIEEDIFVINNDDDKMVTEIKEEYVNILRKVLPLTRSKKIMDKNINKLIAAILSYTKMNQNLAIINYLEKEIEYNENK